MESILVVDDDPGIQQVLRDYLKGQGYQVHIAGAARGARPLIQKEPIDLIILDLLLPDIDGLEFAKQIRQDHGAIGLIILTGKSDVVDRIVGLEVGADDYISKPFHLREMLARIKSVLRRINHNASPLSASLSKVLVFDGWEMDIERRKVVSDQGEELSLTSGDYRLLEIFLQHPNRILSRDAILEQVSSRRWEPFDRSVDTRVRRLRSKIEPDPTNPKYIRTVRGEGYVFTADVRHTDLR